MKGEGKNDKSDKTRLDEYAEWKERYESDRRNPRESFKQVSHIALYMSYDLIDKLRWWEKDTLEQSDEEIAKRIPHAAVFLDRLRAAYLTFADVDL